MLVAFFPLKKSGVWGLFDTEVCRRGVLDGVGLL